jgi:hypothetical protein
MSSSLQLQANATRFSAGGWELTGLGSWLASCRWLLLSTSYFRIYFQRRRFHSSRIPARFHCFCQPSRSQSPQPQVGWSTTNRRCACPAPVLSLPSAFCTDYPFPCTVRRRASSVLMSMFRCCKCDTIVLRSRRVCYGWLPSLYDSLLMIFTGLGQVYSRELRHSYFKEY